jgi:tRNA A-37 threonylcarbamoyl transferase component Bud32
MPDAASPTGDAAAGAPSAAELDAYRAGNLDLARFEAVDRWLGAQPPEEQTRLLAEPHRGIERLPPCDAGGPPAADFATERESQRFHILSVIGAGGMGIVEAAYDRVLGREVALKRCRPRRPDESLAGHAARLRAFKREAAVTSQLEHPGIVPVHDVGSGPHGEPAFVMKRLDGEPLGRLIARSRSPGQPLDLARVAEIMLRVAEAIAYAHRRGIVHRDLKPDNIIVGALGAVYVIDWGLAGLPGAGGGPAPGGALPAAGPAAAPRAGQPTSSSTYGTYRLGTPAWMAPEQSVHSPADARMDVFALGGLLMALLCGHGPRDHGGGTAIDLSPLDRRGLPRGLVAVARHCLATDPAARYRDAAAVAEELRSWLSAGLTQAEKPSLVTRALAKVRHAPRVVALLAGVLVASAATLAVHSAQQAGVYRRVVERVHDIERTLDIGKENDVLAALDHVDDILQHHPSLPEGLTLLTRLRAAQEVFAAKAAQKGTQDRLLALREKYLQKGHWAGEAAELLAALQAGGHLIPPAPRLLAALNSEADLLRSDPLLGDLLAALVRLQRALLLEDAQTTLRAMIPRLISAAGPTPGWRALGEVLAQTEVEEHDLVLAHGPAAEIALDEADTADQLLATFAPEPRLIRVARERWHEDSNAFWPRVISARDCISNGEWREAERHALVALGHEPESLWPHLILAYVALSDGDDQALLREADAGLLQNPDQLELVVLKAVALAHTDRLAAAQALIDRSGNAGHLLYHLRHHSEHPMERSVEALVDAGVQISVAAPTALPPLGLP